MIIIKCLVWYDIANTEWMQEAAIAVNSKGYYAQQSGEDKME